MAVAGDGPVDSPVHRDPFPQPLLNHFNSVLDWNGALFIAPSNQPPSYPSMSPFSCDGGNVNLVLNCQSGRAASSRCSFICNNIRIVFNRRRLSNLSCWIPIWQGSECEWIVCVWGGRGGGYREQCMVGNGVLWSRLTVLPFYPSSFCESCGGVFFFFRFLH